MREKSVLYYLIGAQRVRFVPRVFTNVILKLFYKQMYCHQDCERAIFRNLFYAKNKLRKH